MSGGAGAVQASVVTVSLGHSPDADDVAMWWPITGVGGSQPPMLPAGVRFTRVVAEIAELNRRAIDLGDLDVTAISAIVYPQVARRYRITRCGGSFGGASGPKLVVRADASVTRARELRGATIAVPGATTTAAVVAQLMLGRGAFQTVVMPFDHVVPAVAAGDVDGAVLIHEAQLDVRRLGLRVVADLGRWWLRHTGLPLPLGLNVVRRDLDERLGAGVSRLVGEALSASVRYAAAHREDAIRMLAGRAQERPAWGDRRLVRRYLERYLDTMTVDMSRPARPGRDAIAGDAGVPTAVAALRRLYAEASAAGLCRDPGTIDLL